MKFTIHDKSIPCIYRLTEEPVISDFSGGRAVRKILDHWVASNASEYSLAILQSKMKNLFGHPNPINFKQTFIKKLIFQKR